MQPTLRCHRRVTHDTSFLTLKPFVEMLLKLSNNVEMQSKSSFEVPLPTRTLWGKPASMRQPIVCLHLVATTRHCMFSCAGNRHLCWRAALIQASPKTTPTPALPWSDPQAVSAATATSISSRTVSKASIITYTHLKTINNKKMVTSGDYFFFPCEVYLVRKHSLFRFIVYNRIPWRKTVRWIR